MLLLLLRIRAKSSDLSFLKSKMLTKCKGYKEQAFGQVIFNRVDFFPQRRFSSVCRHFWWLQLGQEERCFWFLLDGCQGCCKASYNAQNRKGMGVFSWSTSKVTFYLENSMLDLQTQHKIFTGYQLCACLPNSTNNMTLNTLFHKSYVVPLRDSFNSNQIIYYPSQDKYSNTQALGHQYNHPSNLFEPKHGFNLKISSLAWNLHPKQKPTLAKIVYLHSWST